MKSQKFFHQSFFRGKQRSYGVVDQDHPCEYSHIDYLAAATAGQEVAVGYLFYSERQPSHSERGHEAFIVHEIPLVVIPDIGIWICQPAFAPLDEAMRLATSQRSAIADTLGASTEELPVELALIAVDDQLPSLAGVDLRHVYDAALFEDPATTLSARRRRDWSAGKVNDTILRLLDAGGWGDAKDPGDAHDWPIPRWLSARIEGSRRPEPRT